MPDFQCFLLAFAKNLQLDKLTMSTDGAIISYINKAIYHHYIALSKAKRHQLPTVSIESQTDYDPLQFDTAFSESDTYNNLLLLDLKRALSTEEYHIIYDHYFRQYSIQEIAARDNKSRQAINKCKKTAIAKLKRYFGVISVFVTHYPVKKADEPFDACNVMFVSYLYAQTNSTRLFFLPQLCGCKSSVALEYPAEIKRVVIPHRHGNILYSQRGIVSNEVGGH